MIFRGKHFFIIPFFTRKINLNIYIFFLYLQMLFNQDSFISQKKLCLEEIVKALYSHIFFLFLTSFKNSEFLFVLFILVCFKGRKQHLFTTLCVAFITVALLHRRNYIAYSQLRTESQ